MSVRTCCIRCQDRDLVPLGSQACFYRTLIVCADCGNKRCPKATDHRLGCTNSNAPNQPGSEFTSSFAGLRVTPEEPPK